MQVETVEIADLPIIEHLQPSDWKGVAEHYHYYISHDNCVPLKLTDAGVVKAVGALIYHQDSAWLAHIIVDPSTRGQGLGTKITQALIDKVDPEYFSSIFLMSTELGYPVYQKLGFEEEGKQLFYISDNKVIEQEKHPSVQPIHPSDYPQVFALDNLAYAEKRTYRLLQGIETALVFKNSDNKVEGVYFPDLLEGPVLALTPEAGKALMIERMKTHAIAIVPENNADAIAVLETFNWKVFRSARRMRLGSKRIWRASLIYNRFSGQIG